jgi:Mitochondrial genome maintenance MGM101
MASLRLSTALGNCARHFHLSRNYTIALTNPVLPRKVSLKPLTGPTLWFAKANASTTTGTETSTSENAAQTTNSPSPNADSVNHVKNENGNGDLNNGNGNGILELQNDWSKSYHGLALVAFPKDVAESLQAPIDPLDIEMKPGGIFVFQCQWKLIS